MGLPIVAGALIAGAAGLAGKVIQNKAQKKEAQRDREFQERMSSTAYQRATADMKLSGINPLLAYAQGGASSPGGRVAKIEDVVGPSVSSAMQMRRMTQELKLIQAQTSKTEQEGYAAMMQGNWMATQDRNATFAPGPGGASYVALQNKYRALLTEAQMRVLRLSPFMGRFIGSENLTSARRLRPRLGILQRREGRAGQR